MQRKTNIRLLKIEAVISVELFQKQEEKYT